MFPCSHFNAVIPGQTIDMKLFFPFSLLFNNPRFDFRFKGFLLERKLYLTGRLGDIDHRFRLIDFHHSFSFKLRDLFR